MIKKVTNIVKKEYSTINWKYHILPVVHYAKHLAKKEKVDVFTVELAALLHDIGKKFGHADHEITGAKETERILRELDASEEVIETVVHAVRAHRASKDYPPQTKVAKIVRDADAIAHFDAIPFIFERGLVKSDGDVMKAIKSTLAKLKRDWDNKMHLAESKRLCKEKYAAAKLVFGAMEKWG